MGIREEENLELGHFFGIAAFVEVADEDGFLGLADEGLGVSEGEVDVGAAAELGAEEDVDVQEDQAANLRCTVAFGCN